jgi:hypothetical protein
MVSIEDGSVRRRQHPPIELNTSFGDTLGRFPCTPSRVIEAGQMPALAFGVESSFIERATSAVDILKKSQ